MVSDQGPSTDRQRPVRVLLVDDDPLVRTGLAAILASASDIAVVGEADDGDQVLPHVALHHPDVVIMDIRMPRVDGLTATGKVTALPNPPKVLVLTTFDLDEYVFDALQAGASGFLLKDASPDEIIHAVRAIAAGDAMLSPRATRTLLTHYVNARASVSRTDARAKLALLSERERQIAAAVAHGKSNADIANELYLSEATVKTHITRILAKLGADNRVQIAILAYQAGLATV